MSWCSGSVITLSLVHDRSIVIDEYVCVCVCVSVSVCKHISVTAHPVFFLCIIIIIIKGIYIAQVCKCHKCAMSAQMAVWLRTVHVTYSCGLVLLRQRCDVWCASGFVDDIVFAHNGQQYLMQKWHVLSDSTVDSVDSHHGIYSNWPTGGQHWTRGRFWYLRLPCYEWCLICSP